MKTRCRACRKWQEPRHGCFIIGEIGFFTMLVITVFGCPVDWAREEMEYNAGKR